MNVRSLFDIGDGYAVSLSTKLEMFGNEEVEIDPLAWPSLRGVITTIWVTSSPILD